MMFENEGFHWRENIFWKRLDDGAVRVAFFAVRALGAAQEGDDDEPVRELIIPPDEWASIVSAVSLKGDDSSRREANLKIAFAEHGIPWPVQQPMTDAEAARYIAHTHPLTQQSDEKPEDFVLRIVRAYDNVKSPDFPSAAISRPVRNEETKP